MWRHLYMAGLAVVVSLGAGNRGFAQGAGTALGRSGRTFRRSRLARRRGRDYTAQRCRTGVARLRHQRLHGAGHIDQPAGASHHRLDSARHRIRDLAQRAGVPAERGAADLARLSHPGNAEAGGRAGRTLHQQRGGRLYVLDAGGHARQPSLAHHGGPAVAAGSGADRRRPCLGLAQGRRRDPGGRAAPPRDYRELCSPYQIINNGQATVISSMRGRPYVRDVAANPNTAAGFEPSPGQVDEGFAIDFSPLLSLDRRTIDATIKCDINQVEAVHPVIIEVPTATSPRQRTKIEVPQVSQYRFHERFRWPVDRVLVVGMGMLPLPLPVDGLSLVPGVPLPLGNSPARGDLLVMVECHGPLLPANATGASAPAPCAKPGPTAGGTNGQKHSSTS